MLSAAMAAEAAAGGSPGALIAQAAGKVSKTAGKRKKNKGFWDIVGGAAKMASELAPIVAPLLIGGANANPRSQLMANAASSAGVPMQAAPIATGSCATCTGVYDIKAAKGKDGRVTGIRCRGMDFLGTLSVNGEELGTLLSDIDLSPLSEDWAGTMLQLQARMYERYRPIRVVGLVEAACPSTTAGQLLAYIDADPDDRYEVGGKIGVQSAATHEGADISQVWQTNAAALAFDQSTQDYYADADGSDERLISPGKWRVIANTVLPATTIVGSLYMIWEYEFKIPQLEQGAGGNFASLASDANETNLLPFGEGNWDDIVSGSATFTGQYGPTGPAGDVSTFWDFPAGLYLVALTGDGASGAGPVVGVDGSNFAPIGGGTSLTASAETAGASSSTSWYFMNVASRESDAGSGYMTVQWPVGAFTEARMVVTEVPSAVASPARRRTLQDFEKMLLQLQDNVAELTARAAAAASPANGAIPSIALPRKLGKH